MFGLLLCLPVEGAKSMILLCKHHEMWTPRHMVNFDNLHSDRDLPLDLFKIVSHPKETQKIAAESPTGFEEQSENGSLDPNSSM